LFSSFYVDLFLSIITDQNCTGLYSTSNTTGVSEEAGTVYPSREQDLPCFVFGQVRVAYLINIIFTFVWVKQKRKIFVVAINEFSNIILIKKLLN
jgi:hypothetical protein